MRRVGILIASNDSILPRWIFGRSSRKTIRVTKPVPKVGVEIAVAVGAAVVAEAVSGDKGGGVRLVGV